MLTTKRSGIIADLFIALGIPVILTISALFGFVVKWQLGVVVWYLLMVLWVCISGIIEEERNS